MRLEKLRRFVKSLICALGATAILMATCALCNLLGNRAEAMFGSKDKLPLFPLWFVEFVPDWDPAAVMGFGIFVIGYGWVAWSCRPPALQAVVHAVMGFFAVALIAFLHPWFLSTGIKEVPTNPPSAWSKVLDHLPWFTVCCAPLAVAGFSWWMRRLEKALINAS